MIEDMKELTWVEVSKQALKHNIQQFRAIAGENRILCPCVKSNAYGHGLVQTSKIFLENGADWLGVNSLYEARTLREAGIESPIYILGYVSLDNLEEAVNIDARIVVYNLETVKKLGEILEGADNRFKIHIKVETGCNRQGVLLENLADFANFISGYNNLEIEGLCTHFANIEDTTDHSYANKQLETFNNAIQILEEQGIDVPIKHCANSAATMLLSGTRFNLVRPGISTYGMWPSNETYVSYLKEVGNNFSLKPAFSWKTKIAQIKEIPAGELIGYGCTFKTSHPTKLAILPIGYYDGYDRGIRGNHVLINGKQAPVRGRVCMNIIMAEITDIPEAKLEDEVILIGSENDEKISAEEFASWVGTINYEITTRVNERIPRILN